MMLTLIFFLCFTVSYVVIAEEMWELGYKTWFNKFDYAKDTVEFMEELTVHIPTIAIHLTCAYAYVFVKTLMGFATTTGWERASDLFLGSIIIMPLSLVIYFLFYVTRQLMQRTTN